MIAAQPLDMSSTQLLPPDDDAFALSPLSYQFHLLLPPTHTDASTVMEFIHEILFDGFARMDDNVQVELHRMNRTVTLTYDQEWSCRIQWNDAPHVLHDAQRWATHHHSTEEQRRIAACTQRLDLYSDPDPERNYYDDYLTLVEHLQVTFDPSWVFDPTQDEFIR